MTCADSAYTALIERIPKTHRYQVTQFGLRAALFFTRVHARLYRPCVAACTGQGPPQSSDLECHFHKLENHIHCYIEQANLAA